MKILLKFTLNDRKIPVDYRRVFLSFFKKSLSDVADAKYYEKYYLNIKRRPFTFAVNLPTPKFSKDYITLGKNEMSLTFTTGDNLAGFVFFSAFLAQKNKSFALPLHNEMTLNNVTKLNEKTVAANSALVKMYSPLCLREHIDDKNTDYYYSVASENFADNSNKILTEQLMHEGFSADIAKNVEIVPINCKKTIVKHYDCMIECSLGEFIINADKSVINYFLRYGIGSRKSAGFGFAELITQA